MFIKALVLTATNKKQTISHALIFFFQNYINVDDTANYIAFSGTVMTTVCICIIFNL